MTWPSPPPLPPNEAGVPPAAAAPDPPAELRLVLILLVVNLALSLRALLRGRRWAYRRVIWIGCAGIVGLLLIQLTPYPPWMRAEQLVQAAVLAALVWCVLRPPVRAYYAPHLPGRTTKRFRS